MKRYCMPANDPVSIRDQLRPGSPLSRHRTNAALWCLLLALAGCSSHKPAPNAGATVAVAAPEERVKLIADNLDKLVVGGRVSNVQWSDDGSSVTFTRRQERVRLELATHEMMAIEPEHAGESRPPRPASARTGRGQQRDDETSPDELWIASCKDWNVIIRPAQDENGQAIPVTTGGHRKFRYGKASWVYGEELDQTQAMWWSPDSRKLVFYEFDERAVPDHFLTAGLTKLHTAVLTEGYPKPGEPNPIANLLIYDLESASTIRVKIDDEQERYVYAVQFSPDGKLLLFNCTNRHQNVLKLMAADLETGECRVVLMETQQTWQDNRPAMRFLKDGVRFVWETERSGFAQYELRDLDGDVVAPLTTGDFPVASIVRIDEDAGVLYYTARSDRAGCALNAQLHCVRLDGGGQRRITREALDYSFIDMSPDGCSFIATTEAADTPPLTCLYDMQGHRHAALAQSDRSRFDELGCTMPELFTFTADDGETDLCGLLYKPSHFDPAHRYPLVIDVYGGPLISSIRNRFTPAVPQCEYGFLIAKLQNRGTPGRGKAFESATYLGLGQCDLADQAAGVRFLAQRPYVDGSRVGITGHSYGGYMAALAVLKLPDVFHVAVAGAPVTDWRNYDTIYTERFMRTPQENAAGYDAGSCLTHVDSLRGKLLLLQGMVDDNVHPNNTWQLVEALQKAGKPFDLMCYPSSGHGLGAHAARLRWGFLRRHLLN